MLKKFVGGFALLAFTFSFSIPGFIGPKPVNADPDLVYYYRTRVTKIGRLGTVCTTYTVDETEEWTTTSHTVNDPQPNGTHWHPVSGNTPSNRFHRERTESVGYRCR